MGFGNSCPPPRRVQKSCQNELLQNPILVETNVFSTSSVIKESSMTTSTTTMSTKLLILKETWKLLDRSRWCIYRQVSSETLWPAKEWIYRRQVVSLFRARWCSLPPCDPRQPWSRRLPGTAPSEGPSLRRDRPKRHSSLFPTSRWIHYGFIIPPKDPFEKNDPFNNPFKSCKRLPTGPTTITTSNSVQ